MFAHILSNSNDESFVKGQWEELTREKLNNFSVSHIPLSTIAAAKDCDILIEIEKVLKYGRRNKQLLWIQENVSLNKVRGPLREVIASNTVHIAKEKVE